MSRTLAFVLAFAGAMTAAVTAAAVALASGLAACYWDRSPLPDSPICGSGLWGLEWVPFAVLGISGLTTVTCVAAGGATLLRQTLGARRLSRALGRRIEAPPSLTRSLESLDISYETQCVDNPMPVAITVGLGRPRIVISTGLLALLNDDEIDAVLCHEAEHARQRHPGRYGLARAAAAAAVPLPHLHQLATRVVLEAEITADAAAVRRCGLAPLVGALLKLSTEPQVQQAVAIGSVHGMLPARIRALEGHVDPRHGPRLRASSWAGLAGVMFIVITVLSAYSRAKGFL